MGSGRVSAPTGQLDPDRVAGGGDRTLAQPDLPDVQTRIAVHREDRVHALHAVRLDEFVRPARDDLLGRLEQQPHADAALAQLVLEGVEDQPGPEDRGSVYVVTARVAHVGNGRGPVQTGAFTHREGVDVGPEGDPVGGLLGPDLGDGSGMPRHRAPRDAGGGEALSDHSRGPDLVEGSGWASRSDGSRGSRAGTGDRRHETAGNSCGKMSSIARSSSSAPDPQWAWCGDR